MTFSRRRYHAGFYWPYIRNIMDLSSPHPMNKSDTASKEQLMDQLRQQIAVANATELLQVKNGENY